MIEAQLIKPTQMHESGACPMETDSNEFTRLNDRLEFEVRFKSLRNGGEILRFACDRTGLADMDSMDRMTLNRYLYARALLGRDFRLEIAPTE